MLQITADVAVCDRLPFVLVHLQRPALNRALDLLQIADTHVLVRFVRACTKLGIAIVASRPMMATTIMISTSVNPLLRELMFFILHLSVVAA